MMRWAQAFRKQDVYPPRRPRWHRRAPSGQAVRAGSVARSATHHHARWRWWRSLRSTPSTNYPKVEAPARNARIW